ncbi:hypothetical protein L3X38_017169 [Prunus dulcis]|uniref:No apical meristem-associated C-terminal domain-containing protein n=1 Tax=Prunus dulcis TaxID=3755 RepID=A0AAD4ZAH3_PRUDU|nr:hypothetical protein L3X38_017169 [Prunus dulcis]
MIWALVDPSDEHISHCFSVQDYYPTVFSLKACLTKANTNTQSGSNLRDVDVYAKTIFLNDNKPPNKPFKLYHAWEILKDCPKWNDMNEPPHNVLLELVQLNILDKFVQEQADAYEYRKQQDKEAQEQKIMSMDVSKFTPRKKKYWGDKQDEIMQEHAGGQQSTVNPEDNSGDYYPSPHDGGY